MKNGSGPILDLSKVHLDEKQQALALASKLAAEHNCHRKAS